MKKICRLYINDNIIFIISPKIKGKDILIKDDNKCVFVYIEKNIIPLKCWIINPINKIKAFCFVFDFEVKQKLIMIVEIKKPK